MSQFFQTREEIIQWLYDMEITNYVIQDDLTVDVGKSVDISDIQLSYIPVQFGRVNGDFYCADNQLTSLAGCPSSVGENFSCQNNQLTSLLGGPSEVGGTYNCNNNKLTSLSGAPKKIKGDFNCPVNQLTSIKDGPHIVYGTYNCFYNYIVNLHYKLRRYESINNYGNLLIIEKSIDEENPGYGYDYYSSNEVKDEVYHKFIEILTNDKRFNNKRFNPNEIRIRVIETLKEEKMNVYSHICKIYIRSR